MQELQLYIEGTRIDLFKDETVSLTQTIQNVKDVAKIFTSFTKTFTIPASSINNKIFKHYYNFDIVGGFDARIKKDARIELNSIPYKTGRIRLEGVALKDGIAYTYKITFFGNTVELPDILGEDTLASLDWSASKYSIPYTAASINQYMNDNVGDGSMLVPLITHTDRLYYNSAENIAGTFNLHYVAGSIKGVVWNQLKFAVRLFEIIEEIELKYTVANGYTRDIVFSKDWFNMDNFTFSRLYMWLHRKSGDVIPAQQTAAITTQLSGWLPLSPPNLAITNTSTGITTPSAMFTGGARLFNNTLKTFDVSNPPQPYIVTIFINGLVAFQSASGIGSRTFSNAVIPSANDFLTVSITSTSSISFANVRWDFDGTLINQANGQLFPYSDTCVTGAFNLTNTFDFAVSEQIPEMSIISFLTSLFKMFSLVAYVDTVGTIVVRPLDSTDAPNYSPIGRNLSYYTSSDINGNDQPFNYDISKFIDTTKNSVSVALPYNEIVYGYEGTGSFLAKQHNQLSGANWGALSYSGSPTGQSGGLNLNASTEIYKVLVPFEHFKYERLIDVANSVNTEIQWGWSVNENRQPYIGKPLIFYYIEKNATASPISLVLSDTSVVSKTTYVMPSNSESLTSSQNKGNINFNNEINEFTNTTAFTDTLFLVYHSKYVIDIFNTRRRITQVNAFLPLRILFDFQLNDTFEISSQRYIINSITTNLQNGKSSIELLNKV